MEKVYIVYGVRTPIGTTNGTLKNCLTEDLAAVLIKDIVKNFSGKYIDSVILGNVVGGGGNVARLSSLKADLDVPAFTIDMQCASGLKSIEIAYAQILCGMEDIIIAGGVESTSMAPIKYYSKNYPKEKRESDFFKVSKFIPDEDGEFTMIEGAERVANKHSFSRENLDQLSIESYKKAIESKAKLSNIRVPIINKTKCTKENNTTFREILVNDDSVREKINVKLLKRVKAILKNGNLITAGNTSATNDGAALVLLCSEKGVNKLREYINKNNIESLFEIKGFVNCSGDGKMSPEMSITVIEKLFEKFNITYDDIDFFEVNEAFTVITALFNEKFKSTEKLNVFGGALAYGHPYGASGGIITIHLMEALKRNKGKLGVVAIPSAGGLGVAMLIERIDIDG